MESTSGFDVSCKALGKFHVVGMFSDEFVHQFEAAQKRLDSPIVFPERVLDSGDTKVSRGYVRLEFRIIASLFKEALVVFESGFNQLLAQRL